MRGLLYSALREAWGGFAAHRFPAAKRAEAKVLMDRLRQDSKIVLNQSDIVLSKEALEFALKELGSEEFQTITGYDFEFGESTLTKLG